MKNRPWPIVLLALMRILSPVSSIFLNAWFIQMSPLKYLYRFVTMGQWFNLVDFFVFPVISGIAVFAMKPWSYPIFLSISAWTLYSNATFAITTKTTPGIWWLLSLFALDFTFVSYFLLLPTVRKIYFDARLRWWEQKPRYLVELDGLVQRDASAKAKECSILDISEGGILIKTKDQFVMNEPVQLNFTCFHLAIRMNAMAVHRDAEMGRYGFQFIDVPKSEQRNLKRLIKALSILQAPLRGTEYSRFNDFKNWVTRLVTQGKGWAPELPSNMGKAKNLVALEKPAKPKARKPAKKTAA